MHISINNIKKHHYCLLWFLWYSFPPRRWDKYGTENSNSRNMWFGQDCPRTALLPSQSKTALNRTAFVFPVCGLAKTGPERYYFQVRAKQLWTEPLLCFQYVVWPRLAQNGITSKPRQAALRTEPLLRYQYVVWPRLAQNGLTSQSEQNSFEQNRFCVSSGV